MAEVVSQADEHLVLFVLSLDRYDVCALSCSIGSHNMHILSGQCSSEKDGEWNY